MHVPAPVFTFLAFALALGVLVFVHELGHFMVAKRVGVRVLRFSIGFGPIVFARRRGETEYALSAMPLGGYVKMLGDEDDDDPTGAAQEPDRAFPNQAPSRRAGIVVAGPAMNFVFAFLVYALLFAAVGAEVPSNEPRVGGLAPGSAAEAAGLHVGDQILAVDAQPITTWEELSHRVLDSGGKPLTLSVKRDDARAEVVVTPQLKDSRTMFGEDAGQVYRIGIEASRDWQKVGPLAAIGMAAEQTWTAATVVLKGLVLMIAGRVPLRITCLRGISGK